MPGVVATTDTAAGRRKLIINADDFGMSTGINRGIMEAVAAGSVTSASLMVGMPGFDDAVSLARQAGDVLGVGVHLTLTVGRPLTRAATLVDASTGEFVSPRTLLRRALSGHIRPTDVFDECAAQIARARHAGLPVTHVDGHLHVHVWPGVAHVVRHLLRGEGITTVRVPNEALYGVPLWRRRLPERAIIRGLTSRARMTQWPVATADHFVGSTLLGMRDFESGLLRVLDALAPGTTELMVHPGYVDGPLPGNDGYRAQRETELRALTSQSVRDRLRRQDLQLIHFASLSKMARAARS
jgi:predicted glycoside hydrolase/deacetylase ChbG (UPF0249 family)